ncbi:hypothetical protein FACS1894142_6720 [Spirochaetia bacterium]|nr:hypothetical protein FACS1894142_6720 [Spirochaetia bacterium]GHU59701.1 hypothetical protein FACS189444_5480 [Spirochaetia bacterium]
MKNARKWLLILFVMINYNLFSQEMEIGEFLGLEGIRLCWQSWHPAEKPKAVIVLMHGGNNYSDMELFRNFAGELTDAGYCVYSFDQRGFGRSEGIRMHMGKWENIRGDYAAFLHFIRIKEGDEIKIFAIGSSFGALQTLDQGIVSPHLLSGVIVMSVSTIPLKIPFPFNVLLPIAGTLFPKSTISAEPLESFSGAKILLPENNLWADPLCPATQTYGNLKELLKRQKQIPDDLKYLTVPILHLQGEKDTIALIDQTLLEKCSSADKTYHKYPNAEHEMLASIDKEQIVFDIISWLDERIDIIK